MGRDGRATLEDIFAVLRDRSLTLEERLLWGILRSYETEERGAHPGDELLAATMDKSARSVERYRAELLRRGYLRQTLRGPKPATYRAVLPDRNPDTRGEASPERDDTGGEASPPERDDTDGGSSKASPKGSPKASPYDPTPVSPEYGEYGEYGEETASGGSSLRSSPPEPGARVENSDGENSAPLEESWRARLAPLIRDVAYQGEDPPGDHSLGRCLSKARQLLERGYSADDLEDAIHGLRLMAERGDPEVRDWMCPDDRFTLLAFDRAEEQGERLVQLAAHSWRKHTADAEVAP